MILLIDSLDGLGPLDYSAAIDGSAPATVNRVLNGPSTFGVLLCLVGSALPVPARRARVRFATDAGVLLFTGYVTVDPLPVYAGCASEGPVYRLVVGAVSDEWLLDKQGAGSRPGEALNTPLGTLVEQLAGRLAPGLLSTKGLTFPRPLGVFVPGNRGPETWSAHAGAAAAAGYAVYRALDGALALATGASTVHPLADGEARVTFHGVQPGETREMANDVTLSGAREPAAFWTELFQGDGTTVAFPLTGEPAAPAAGHAVLVNDGFTGSLLDPNFWSVTDPGSHITLDGATATGGGLSLNGGNGLDGQTTLLTQDPVELGGTLVAELGAVTLNGRSAGVLCGFYAGDALLPNCVAGFGVSTTGGQTSLQPVVNGTGTGTSFPMQPGHFYTLRLHAHCPEPLRVKQTFYALAPVDTGGPSPVPEVVGFGGGLVDAPLSLVFTVRDEGASSNTPVTVLYDGTMASAPAQAIFVVLNSLELFGSLGAVSVARTGSAWVRSTPPGASAATRLIGKAAQGVDCALTGDGSAAVTFFAGRVPAPAEPIAVSYRGRAQSVARLADPASLAAEVAGNAAGTLRWVGKVVTPVARTSEDCENAALALLSFATDRAATVSGSLERRAPLTASSADLWPGDLLQLPAGGGTSLGVLARSVVITADSGNPGSLTYRVAFANDWAEGLAIQLSETLAPDAPVPARPMLLTPAAGINSTPTLAPHAIASLQSLAVVAANGSLTVDAGLDPPAGGGFEVRRREANFGTGSNGGLGAGDLVLRSPVRGFTIPRAAVEEVFFVRMYDGSVPPLYSRSAAAIATHLPVGS